MPSDCQCPAERLAEWLRLARQEALRALDQGDGAAHPPQRLRHLDTHRPAAEHQQPARQLAGLEAGHLAVRPDALQLAQPVDRRDHRIGTGRDHDVAGGVRLAADLDRAGRGDAALAAQDRDAVAPSPTRPDPSRRSPTPCSRASASADSTSRSPVTASAAPGARRASVSASPGRSSVFDGMQAQ